MSQPAMNQQASQLTHFVEVALLGTARGSLPAIPDDSTLNALLARLENVGTEHRLLGMVGAISLYEQVGELPQRLAGTDALRLYQSR